MATTTPKNGLPLIDSSMTADVPRDLNALANAVDSLFGDMDSVPTASKEVAGAITELRQSKAPLDSPTFTGTATASAFKSTVSDGTSPFAVTSQTQVQNLNADMVDGYHLNQDVRTTASPTFATVSGRQLIATVANGTPPISVSSQTKVEYLNVDMVDGKHSTDFLLQPQYIGEGVNLNTCTTPGMYYCPADATAITLVNSPTSHAFSLFIEKHAGVKQTVTEYMPDGTAKTWIRNYYSYSGVWGAWTEVYTSNSGTISGSRFLAGQGSTTGGGYGFSADGAQDTGMYSSGDGMINFYANAQFVAQLKNDGIYNCVAGNLSSPRVRNTTVSQAYPSGGIDGDIWIQY